MARERLTYTSVLAGCIAIAGLCSLSVRSASANLLANGSFETASATTGSGAANWQAINGGGTETYTIDPTAEDGLADIHLVVGAPGNAGVLQNSVADGGQPPLSGDPTPLTLTFFIRGTFGDTGNLTYDLRYLDNTGAIVGDAGQVTASSGISTTGWTKETLVGPNVPASAVAAYVELNAAAGPAFAGNPEDIYIDNVSVTGAATPEPASLGLLGAGALALMARRRRTA